MKRILLWLLIIIVVLAGVSFSVLNADSVIVDYYFAKGEVPLSIVIVGALAIGALLGIASTFWAMFRLRREISRLKKQLKVKEQEVNNLRAIPMMDKH